MVQLDAYTTHPTHTVKDLISNKFKFGCCIVPSVYGMLLLNLLLLFTYIEKNINKLTSLGLPMAVHTSVSSSLISLRTILQFGLTVIEIKR